MAALLLTLPSLFLLAAPAAGQVRQVHVLPVPPPFIQAPPMLMNMVDVMERVVNELMPQPMVPQTAGPEIAAEVKPVASEVAGNKSHPDRPARPPTPPPEAPIDIKLEPLAGPELPVLLPFPRIVPARALQVAKEVESAPRKRIKVTAPEHNHPHHKVAILEVSKANGSEPVLQAVPRNPSNTSTEHKTSGPPAATKSSAEPKISSPSKVVARQQPEAAAQQLLDDTRPAAAAAVAASGDSATSGKSAEQSAKSSPSAGDRKGNDKPTDTTSSSSDSGLASACYGLFLRHGVLILVLAVLCGVSCLVGALLPVLCKRRRGQVSQFPPKRHFTAGRIFADPTMARIFRRGDSMVA